MSRGRIGLIAGLALLAAVCIAFALYLHGKSLTLRITEPQMREQLAMRFPIERTSLLLLRWRLTNPQVSFLPQRQRVVLGLDARLNARLDGQRDDLGGRIEVETALRYDTGRGAFFLIDPVITRLAIDGIPEAHVMRVQTSVRGVLAEMFAQVPVYTLRQADLFQDTARRVLEEVRIEDESIVVVLGL